MYERAELLTDAELQALVVRYYGIEGRITGVRAGYMSTTATVGSDRGCWVLKVVSDEDEMHSQIQFGVWFNQMLSTCGIPVPSYLLTLDDRLMVSESGCVFTLCEWIEGAVFTPGHCAQLQSAGEMLGRIHLAGEGFVSNAKRISSVDIVGEVTDVLDTVDLMDGEPRRIGQILRTKMNLVVPEILDDLPLTVVHGDYRAQNLLFGGSEISGVLDFDAACVAPRLMDLSYALAFFQAVIASRPLSESDMAIFLGAYRRLIILTSEEYAQLPFWMALALLKGLALWLRIAFVEGLNLEIENGFPPYLDLLARIDKVVKRVCQRAG